MFFFIEILLKELVHFGKKIETFFLFSLTSLTRLFHSYRDEPIGGWGETGVPRENHLTHPQAEHWLVSHVASAGLEPTPVTAVR